MIVPTDQPTYLSPRLQLVQHALGLARLGTLQVRSGTLVDPEVEVEVEEVVVVVEEVEGEEWRRPSPAARARATRP